MTTAIKPCPFCGSTNVTTTIDHNQGYKYGFAECECGVCAPEVRTGYEEGPDAPWRNNAIAAWNDRIAANGAEPIYQVFLRGLKVFVDTTKEAYENNLRTCPEDVRVVYAAPVAQPVCGCGDTITAHDPGICGNCFAMKYRDSAVAKDAERYRWLKAHYLRVSAVASDSNESFCLNSVSEFGDTKECDALNSAIDAAIAASAEKEHK